MEQPGVLRVRLHGMLGRGSHSVVLLGRHELTQEAFAVKTIALADKGAQLFELEKDILTRLPLHRNIVSLLGTHATPTTGYLVLEYLPMPTLSDLLSSIGALTVHQAAYVLGQLVEVIRVLAHAGFAHRDVKADNLMINPETFSIKLIDFSLGTCIATPDAIDTAYRGTPIYMAPEVLRRDGQPYSIVQADLWSAGMIYWECLLGRHPFFAIKSTSGILAAVQYIPDYLQYGVYPGLDAFSIHLLQRVLHFYPTWRLNIEQILHYLVTSCLFEPTAATYLRSLGLPIVSVNVQCVAARRSSFSISLPSG